MNRIRAFVLAASLLLCSAPMLATTVSAAESDDNLDVYIDDYYTSMDGISGLNDIITEEKVEEIKQILNDFLLVDEFQAVVSLFAIFWRNKYVHRIFMTSVIFALVSSIIFGNK